MYLMLSDILLTVQVKQWWNSLAVRYSCWIRYTVFPQVGEVVWRCQDYAANLRPSPDLRWHRGADEDPSAHTDHKAANFHVHHHGPVAHVGVAVQLLDGETREPNSRHCGTPLCPALTAQSSLLSCCTPMKKKNPHWITDTRMTPFVVCVHHHMFCLEPHFLCFVKIPWVNVFAVDTQEPSRTDSVLRTA